MEEEHWVDIPEYKGLYQMSNKKRIKSLQRISLNGRLLKEKILKTNNSRGYKTIWLSKNNKQKLFYVDNLYFKIFGENNENI